MSGRTHSTWTPVRHLPLGRPHRRSARTRCGRIPIVNVAGAAPFTNVRRPPRPALATPRPALTHAQAAATPTPWPGPSFNSTNCVLPWQAHRFARRPEYLGDLGFSKKNGRISGWYHGISL